MLQRVIDAILRGYGRVAPTSRGGYRLARLGRRFHRDRERAVFVTPQGIRLQLNLNSYPDCSMAYGLFEVETARAIRRILRPGDTFIDGGANIGYFTTIAAKVVGERGHVHAFEPEPGNVSRLQEHLVSNGLEKNVSIHAVALADRPGEMQLHQVGNAGEHHALATLFATPGAATRAISVAIVRLDDYLPQVVPRLIKLDIEGAEPLAVEGMRETLRRHRPSLIVELNADALARGGSSPQQLVSALLRLVPEYTVEVIGWRMRPLRTFNLRNDVNVLLTVPDGVSRA